MGFENETMDDEKADAIRGTQGYRTLEAMRDLVNTDPSRKTVTFADLAASAKTACAPFVLIRVGGRGGEEADIALFEDGSGFCIDMDRGGCDPYPLAYSYEQPPMMSEMNPMLDGDTAPFFERALAAEEGIGRLSRRDAEEIDGGTDLIERIAAETPDPPEALRDLLVEVECDTYWEDREGKDRAQRLIAQLATYHLGSGCRIRIATGSVAGRPPAQRDHDEQMMKFMLSTDRDFISRHQARAMYSGLAYAEIEEAYGIPFERIVPVNDVLAWFSIEVLSRLGRPVGWETDYNDGAYARQSGYSAYSYSIEIDAVQPSNHERIQASTDVRSFLEAHGLEAEFAAVCEAAGISDRLGIKR